MKQNKNFIGTQGKEERQEKRQRKEEEKQG
jgi:hypothetical protein